MSPDPSLRRRQAAFVAGWNLRSIPISSLCPAWLERVARFDGARTSLAGWHRSGLGRLAFSLAALLILPARAWAPSRGESPIGRGSLPRRGLSWRRPGSPPARIIP